MVPVWKAGANVALVNVDPQVDFCPGGNLAIPGADKIMPFINSLREHFNLVVNTQDWHPKGHKSFASSHPGAAPFSETTMPYGRQTLWPDHCIQGSKGAQFHPDFVTKDTDLLLRKGTNPEIDSYSAFEENDGKTSPTFSNGNTFAGEMRARKVDTLVFTGLARDICVAFNARSAIREGFRAIVVLDASQPLNAENDAKVRRELEALGVEFVNSNELEKTLARPAPRVG
jgi:nicotinamidase/pyrazinamidase